MKKSCRQNLKASFSVGNDHIVLYFISFNLIIIFLFCPLIGVFFFTTVKVVFITGGEALPQYHYHLTLFDIENSPAM